MLKRTVIGFAAVVLLFLGYVALQPSSFHIERASIVVAPPSAVFAEVNDFRNWEAWSPWARLDPDAKATFEGPASGEGAVFHWAGNREVGEGRMTVVESRPDERIRIRVDFVKPWEGTSTSEFTFRPDGPRTIVTWAMSGEQTFVQKAVCVFFSLDKMLGAQFEKGLASLKSVVEGKLG